MLTTLARRTALGAFALAASLVVALHGVRRDLSPVGSRLSEYANGPWGWLMTAAFLVLAGGCFGLAVARAAAPERGARLQAGAAAVAGVGLVASGVFPTGGTPVVEVLHSRASGAATLSLVVLVLASSAARLRRPGGRWDGAAVAWVLSVGVLAAAGPVLHDSRWTGLGQRLLWGALLLWLVGAAGGRADAAPGGARPAVAGNRQVPRGLSD